MRQTCLSLSELISAVDSREHPRCLFVNEVGEVYQSRQYGDDERAMRKLIELLRDPDFNVRFIAFCFLTVAPQHEDVITALSAFRAIPENATVVKRAHEYFVSEAEACFGPFREVRYE